MLSDNDLLKVLDSHQPNSITLTELYKHYPTTTRRSVQRRLKRLADKGKIIAEGKPRSRSYRISMPTESLNPSTKVVPVKTCTSALAKKDVLKVSMTDDELLKAVETTLNRSKVEGNTNTHTLIVNDDVSEVPMSNVLSDLIPSLWRFPMTVSLFWMNYTATKHLDSLWRTKERA